MIERERKMNLEKLSPEQADQVSAQLGEKIKEINDKAIAEINRFLNIYGMEAKTQIVVGKLGEFEAKTAKKASKPKKTRKKKQANL